MEGNGAVSQPSGSATDARSNANSRGTQRAGISPGDFDEELSPIFGDGRSRSGGGGYGLTVGRLGDDLDPIIECHTDNEFWQLVVAIETTPASLGGLEQFEDHRECRLVGEAALRSDGAVANGGEGAFDGVGNRYEISRCQRSAAVFCVVAYGATIGTEAPGARCAGRPMHTMSRELELVAGRLCDSPGCAGSANP
ncbi:hypothetical protein ACVWZ6_002793 [Bradyrhizobium sp. GM6.1]